MYNVLKDITEGFYIDVGANDPWEISVTKVFYDKGWKGINVEPLNAKYSQLCSDRKRDVNLQIGVGALNGNLPFYETIGNGTGSTMSRDVAIKMMKCGEKIIKRDIPIYTMGKVCKDYIPPLKIGTFIFVKLL